MSWWQKLFGVWVVLLLYVAGCGPKTEPLTPDALGDSQRLDHLTGAEAEQQINRLHGKVVTPSRNEVAVYRSGDNEAILYVSQYREAIDARKAEESMRRRISLGNQVFAHYHEIGRNGLNVAACVGLGRRHYFFAHADRLYWLEADPSASQQVLNDLLVHVSNGVPL